MLNKKVNQKFNVAAEMHCTFHCTNTAQFSPTTVILPVHQDSILLKTHVPIFEIRPTNQKVGSSNPPGRTIFFKKSHLVDHLHQLPKLCHIDSGVAFGIFFAGYSVVRTCARCKIDIIADHPCTPRCIQKFGERTLTSLVGTQSGDQGFRIEARNTSYLGH
jgi:hypothetical protein